MKSYIFITNAYFSIQTRRLLIVYKYWYKYIGGMFCLYAVYVIVEMVLQISY